MEEALLTPICDPSLHCIVPPCIQLCSNTPQILVRCVHNEHFALCIAPQLDKNCNVGGPISQVECTGHSTVQKIEMFTFPKRKFVIIVRRRETRCLALQVNCHILEQLSSLQISQLCSNRPQISNLASPARDFSQSCPCLNWL